LVQGIHESLFCLKKQVLGAKKMFSLRLDALAIALFLSGLIVLNCLS
jgi:hypothetical protein